jgi:thiol:disulfide interchange protein DsbD
MKKAGFIVGFLFFVLAISAQNPVSWTFTAKKIGSNSYEVHMTASIQASWHLYSQKQPEDAIAIPTSFFFNNNPLLALSGTIKEIGKMEKFTDKELGLSANQYSTKVDFVQVVNLKGKATTNFTGSVEYQTCDDKKCLPPKTVNFNVALN